MKFFILLLIAFTSYGDVHQIYKKNKFKLNLGLSEFDGWVFYKNKMPVKKYERASGYQMKSMLKFKTAIQKELSKNKVFLDFKFAIDKDKNHLLIEKFKEGFIHNFTLPNAKVLANHKQNGEYLYIVAFDKRSLDLSRKETLIQVDLNSWLKFLRELPADNKLDMCYSINFYEGAFFYYQNHFLDTGNDFAGLYQDFYTDIKYIYDSLRFKNKQSFSIAELRESVTRQVHYKEWLEKIEDINLDKYSNLQFKKYIKTLCEYHGRYELGIITNNEANKFLEEAETLFFQGKDLNKIIDLLLQSIEVNPDNPRAYQFLGASLLAKEMYVEASLVLVQYLQFDTSNSDVLVNLAKCYERMGNIVLRNGVVYYIKILNKESEYSQKYTRSIWREINNE